MKDFLALVHDKILWIVVSLALWSGLIAAYGRERHVGSDPDLRWWINRACIMPVLAIMSAFLIDQFSLNNIQSAMLSSTISMMGFAAIDLWLWRAKKIAGAPGADVVAADAQAAARPYFSKVDVDDAQRPTAHVQFVKPDAPRRSATGGALREAFRQPTNEPIPEEQWSMLDKLDKADDQ